MSSIIVVGSGPSGVHLAQTLLDQGHHVTMLDVGNERPEPVMPTADFDELKTGLPDPVAYFLGEDGRGVALPDENSKYFEHPPSKDYVFASRPGFRVFATQFSPMISFAAGGLAEAWTAGVYPLNDGELAEFPIDYASLAPHYETVSRRIGITGAKDDLARFNPWSDSYLEPTEPDPHTARLLERYAARRGYLNSKLGFFLGRSRVAVLTRDHLGRQKCDRLGRCLWGCPRRALYAPSSTLRQMQGREGFAYVPDSLVTHFDYEDGRITGISALGEDGRQKQYVGDVYVLAAGTLCSSKILLDSIFRRTGVAHELGGLMDNSVLMVPFVSLRMIGRPVETHSYQFHQLAIGIERPQPADYVHGQVTTLKAASVHPIVQNLPVGLRAGLDVFRQAHAALGAANLWLPDRRNPANRVTIRPRAGSDQTDLVIDCLPDDASRFREAYGTLRRALRSLGCVVPPGMAKLLPRGTAVHYSGTVPMRSDPAPLTCSSDCRSHDFRNLYFADGTSFPFLPAKNLTFTLMANAVRVAEAIDRTEKSTPVT